MKINLFLVKYKLKLHILNMKLKDSGILLNFIDNHIHYDIMNNCNIKRKEEVND